MTDEMNKELRALIANLAAVVRVQNGNRHADTNAMLDHANRVLSTLSAMSALEQPAAPAQPVAAQQAATFTRHNKGGSGEFIGCRWNMPYADTLNLPDEGALYFGPPAQPVAAQPMPVAWRYKSVAIVDGVRVPIKQVDENRLEWEITQNPPRDHSNLSYPLNYPLISDYEPLYAAAPPAQQESKDAERWVACLRQEYDARAKISTESQKLAVPFEAYKADADKHMDAAIAASKSKGDA